MTSATNTFVTVEDLVQHYHINRIYIHDKSVRIIIKSDDGILPWLLADIPIRYLSIDKGTMNSWFDIRVIRKNCYLNVQAKHKLMDITYDVAGKLIRDLMVNINDA